MSSTKEGARARRNRTRAAITTAAALVAAAAFSAGPAHASVVPSAVDPNTTVPNSFTDETGLDFGLCTNNGCAGVRPDLNQALAVPGNFSAAGEAFWYLNEAVMPSGSLVEFAVEGAFEDIAPHQGGAFTRQRFRFDNLTGTVRITTPYGVRIYDNLAGGTRAINDTVDLGLVGGCGTPPAGGFCDYAGANYGNELTRFLVPATFDTTPGAVTVHSGPVVGSPTGFNGVRVEQQTGTDVAGNPIWTLIEETTTFNVEFQTASAPSAPLVFAGINTNAVDFMGRRSDESSGTKRVTVRNDGAAPMNISGVALSGVNAGSFTASGCGGTLAPGATCDVVVGFTATAGVGTHEATLTITNDSVNAPALQVAVSGVITGLPTGPPPPAPPAQVTQLIQQIPGVSVLGAQTSSSSLAVSRLTLARRISVTRLRAQGLRATMNVQEGTSVVRFAVYKARGGRKTGRSLYTTTRTPTRAGLYRAVLRSSKLAKLKPGQYVMEVRAGRSAASLGAVKKFAFTVTR